MPAQSNDILYSERLGIPGTLTAQEVADLLLPKLQEYTRQFVCYSELGLINQTVAFEPFFVREAIPNVDNTGTWSVTLPEDEDGDYMLELDMAFSYNSETSDFISQVLVDGVDTEIPLRIEPKDVLGGGIQLPTVAGGVVSTTTVTNGNNQILLASGKKLYSNLTAGTTKTFRLEFAGQNVDQEAVIFNATLAFKRVINSNI